MPRHDVVTTTAGTWTKLSADGASVSAATWCVTGYAPVRIGVTADDTPPAIPSLGVDYETGQGEVNMSLADFAPGVSSGAVFWGYSDVDSAVFVSHA